MYAHTHAHVITFVRVVCLCFQSPVCTYHDVATYRWSRGLSWNFVCLQKLCYSWYVANRSLKCRGIRRGLSTIKTSMAETTPLARAVQERDRQTEYADGVGLQDISPRSQPYLYANRCARTPSRLGRIVRNRSYVDVLMTATYSQT